MIPFAKQLSGLLITGTVLFFACKHSDVLPVGYLSLGVNESANLASGIAVRVDSIQDSRCPEGAQCIVAGSASVTLLFTRDNASLSVRLTDSPLYETGKGYVRQDSTVAQVGNQKLSVILRDIVPHRGVSDYKLGKQKALVQVSFL